MAASLFSVLHCATELTIYLLFLSYTITIHYKSEAFTSVLGCSSSTCFNLFLILFDPFEEQYGSDFARCKWFGFKVHSITWPLYVVCLGSASKPFLLKDLGSEAEGIQHWNHAIVTDSDVPHMPLICHMSFVMMFFLHKLHESD